MCAPMRRCQAISQQAREELRKLVLTDLEAFIDEAQRKIANLRIAGFHRKAEEKRRSLRFFWEFYNELQQKIDNIEG